MELPQPAESYPILRVPAEQQRSEAPGQTEAMIPGAQQAWSLLAPSDDEEEKGGGRKGNEA